MKDNHFEISKKMILSLGCSDEYYDCSDKFWFEKDHQAIFTIKNDGTILIQKLFSEKKMSIYDLWNFFDEKQKKLIVFNLDKFL